VVISPTWVQTEMFDSSMAIQARNAGRGVDEEIAAIVEDLPQKRLVQPRELGALAAFLCRDEALGITMEDIQLNTGALW
jgi:3-hydroxybutyrate dehydrogenase